MDVQWQNIIILVAVALAVLYLVKYLVRNRREKKKCCANCGLTKIAAPDRDNPQSEKASHR